ncbi:MAG: diguanylate cyclase [Campylobacterales bacterium]|nr:diguanylate cyclase [Campylobacterales bacterium]
MFRVLVLLFVIATHLYAQKSFVVYVNQHVNNDNALSRWQPTIDYLNKQYPQYHFSLLPIKPTHVDTIKKLLDEKKIDFLITQPAIFAELKYTHNINALLTMSNKYKMSKFGSVIITHQESKIKTIKDIKGKRVIAIAPFGFGGWLVGYNELLKHAINPLKEDKVTFVGSQKKVIEQILAKKADVGIVRTGMIEKLSNEMDLSSLYVINQKKCKKGIKLSTQLFPEWAFAVASHVDLQVVNDVFDALVALKHDSYPAKAGEFNDWHLPHSYSDVDKMMQTLHIGYYKDMPRYTINDIVYVLVLFTLLFAIAIIYSHYRITYTMKLKLEEEVQHKTNALERANVELNTLFDLNPHITIITDGVHIQRVNRRFLDFLEINTLDEFTQTYDCICDRFEDREGYLQAKMGEQTWIEYVEAHPNFFHKALIIQNDKEYIFSIHLANIHYLDNATYIVSLEDITKINTIASTDKLTCLFNRVKLDEILSQLIQKNQTPFSIALIDIDFFKRVNDKYGHIIGDKVLIDLAKLLQNKTHEKDIVGRWGGEEFMIIFEDTIAQNAYKFMERIRKVVEKHSFKTLERQTISIGIAQYNGNKITIEQLIDQADQALYQAKHNGRNQTIVYDS